jgi:hypothetical protein
MGGAGQQRPVIVGSAHTATPCHRRIGPHSSHLRPLVCAGRLLAAVVDLMEHPTQVRSVLVQSKLVNLLLAMLAPQIALDRRNTPLGASYIRPGGRAGGEPGGAREQGLGLGAVRLRCGLQAGWLAVLLAGWRGGGRAGSTSACPWPLPPPLQARPRWWLASWAARRRRVAWCLR